MRVSLGPDRGLPLEARPGGFGRGASVCVCEVGWARGLGRTSGRTTLSILGRGTASSLGLLRMGWVEGATEGGQGGGGGAESAASVEREKGEGDDWVSFSFLP